MIVLQSLPYLYELDTVAYFAIKRNLHTYSTIAGIRETTQLLLDLYRINDGTYIHLKGMAALFAFMFFPMHSGAGCGLHHLKHRCFERLTASTEAK